MYDSLDNLVYNFLFTFQRESHSVPDMDIFYYTFNYFVPIGVFKDRVNKTNSKYFNGKL